MYVVTNHVFLFVGTGLWGQAIICRVMCSRDFLDRDFFFFFLFTLRNFLVKKLLDI